MSRAVKQILFGIIFIIVFGLLGFWIYKIAQPTPTCFDKVKNQGEEGVDCGKVCGNVCLESLEPIKVLSSNLFKIRDTNGKTDYDALFRVSNPNIQFGSGNIEYSLNILSVNGDLISPILSKTGSFYILPGQTKYVYEPLLEAKTSSGGNIIATLEITKVDWQKLVGIFSRDIKLMTKSKQYLVDNKPGIYSQVNGIITNASDFDLDRVDVAVVLFKNNVAIGANRIDIRTLVSGSDRFFEVDWISPLSVVPDRVDVEPTTNVFQDSNFIRRYGVPEKFQQLY